MVSESYDPFEALCDAAFDGEEDGLMLFWKSCMDASGKHSDLLAVAGYLGNRHTWKTFNKAWREPLTLNGKIDIFHASDFEAGQCDFTEANGWPKERIDTARTALVDALLGAQLQKGFACLVKISDYEATVPRWMRELPGLGSAYEFAVSACMGVAARWAQDNGIPDLIQYVVEHGEGKEGKLQEAFNRAFALPRSRQFFRLGRLIFDTKDGAIGLQAADMLANYMWAWKSGMRNDAEPYSRITNDPNLRWEYFDKEHIERQMRIDQQGRTTVTAEGTIYRKTPEPIDIEVKADFAEAEALLAELELLAETCPERVYSLIKHSPSFEKLFSVNSKNISAAATNDLRITFKPNDLGVNGISALRALKSNCDLGEGEVH